MEDEQFPALALDGEKRQVQTVASVAGHCLWARIIAEERVPAVVKRLLSPDMYSGWGVRTLGKSSAAYNPMSYYNGSVWPFDNAILARALKKHGFSAEANRLAGSMFDAALEHEYSRLPEFFCGFTRQAINKPVLFPMACSPDIGAAGAVFMMLQAILGLYPNAEENVALRAQPPAAALAGRGRHRQPGGRPFAAEPAVPPPGHAHHLLGARQAGRRAGGRRRVARRRRRRARRRPPARRPNTLRLSPIGVA